MIGRLVITATNEAYYAMQLQYPAFRKNRKLSQETRLMQSKYIRAHIIAAVSVLVAFAATSITLAANGGDSSSDYTALRMAVLDGKDIRMVLDLSTCTAQQSDKPGPAVSGSLRFDAYMIQGGQTIAFATTHFTLRPDTTPVYEFLAFQVHPPGEVDARTRFLNATTFAVMQDSTFNCSIGRGVTFHW